MEQGSPASTAPGMGAYMNFGRRNQYAGLSIWSKKEVKPPGPGGRSMTNQTILPGLQSRTRWVFRPDEVKDIHAIRTSGELRPVKEVEIVGEDADGNLALVADRGFWTEEKMDLMEHHGFQTFIESERVSRQGVFGWLPAEMVHDIKSVVRWRKDAG